MVIKSRICWMWAVLSSLALLVLPCAGQQEMAQAYDQKLADSVSRIGSTLDTILTDANTSRAPAAGSLSSWQSLVNESRRYFAQMDDKQKAQYCLLQSWMAYYSGQVDDAHMNAAKACKLDATSGDAWASQVAMAMVAGKRPMLPRPPKPARSQRGRGAQGMEGTMPDTSSQVQPGKLSFDLSQLLADALNKKIESLELQCLNGTAFKYQAGNEALCAMLWQKFETKKITPSNEPNQRKAGAPPMMPMPPMPPMMEYSELGFEGGMPGQPGEGTPVAAFGRLFRTGLSANGKVKFLAVNLDSASYKPAVIDEILMRPQAWAQVVVADQAGDAFAGFNGVMPNRPLLIMTDTTGAIRYAGPVNGFIAPMVLRQLMGPGLAEINEPQEVQNVQDVAVAPADSNSVVNPTPTPVVQKPVAKPVEQPVVQQPEQPTEPQQQYKELSEEDAIQAERKLTYARDLFMQLGKKAGMNYTRGVKLCREILKEYPNTEYAEQSRELLRQIPENQRGRYNLTDEELGL